jgi:hypothetical protein
MIMWKEIETAPQDGTQIDVWAKSWDGDSGTFVFRRFAEVIWNDEAKRWKPRNVPPLSRKWHVTHWTEIVDGPRT